jgi:hypothetical protein
VEKEIHNTTLEPRQISCVNMRKEEFYATEAMINHKWMEARYKLRHVATRMAVHGFHHMLCNVRKFHTPDKKVNANHATNDVNDTTS